jgi:hypothetical protein
MKKITIFFTFCFLLFAFAQAQVPPNAFNYSAVARNAGGQPIATSTIGIQISILKTSSSGTAQYIENHFVNTDAYGLFNLVIGAGTVQSGSISNIDWSNDNYFLKVDMDASGGSNFITMGTTQLLSVPYALHAKSAGSVVSGGGFIHYIGEQFGGGVIFHLWKDDLNVEHGLIVDTADLSTAQTWSNVNNTQIGVSAQSFWNGLSNSNAIVGQAGHTSSAAALCLNSTNGGQSDWYLPSIDELSLLWHNRFGINKKLSTIAGATILLKDGGQYVSSTEESITINPPFRAHFFVFTNGKEDDLPKNTSGYVRAIRAF